MTMLKTAVLLDSTRYILPLGVHTGNLEEQEKGSWREAEAEAEAEEEQEGAAAV